MEFSGGCCKAFALGQMEPPFLLSSVGGFRARESTELKVVLQSVCVEAWLADSW